MISCLLSIIIALCSFLIVCIKEKGTLLKVLAGIILFGSIISFFLNKDAATKASEEISRLNAELSQFRQETIGSADIPFIRLVIHSQPQTKEEESLQYDYTKEDYHTAKLFITNKAELPIYDLSVRAFNYSDWFDNMTKGPFPMSTNRALKSFEDAYSYYNYQILYPHDDKEIVKFKMSDPFQYYDLNIEFKTRYSTGSEVIRATYVKGKWIIAYRLIKWEQNKPHVIYENIPKDFPARKSGDIQLSEGLVDLTSW